MIPNEMKSWREVMDDVARLTKERDEAREEVSQLHMRAASWPGYNIEAAKAEIASLRAEVERLRNLYEDAKQSANAWRSVRGISEREHELERQLAEARAEIARMREIEGAELRAARDEAIRLGKERDERQRNDWAESARQWKIAEPFTNAETNGKTWGEIIKLYGEKAKAAEAEVARLRAAQNERAIAELEDQVKRVNFAATKWAKDRDGGVDRHEADRCDARVQQLTGVAFYMGQRIAALRAEQAAAPAPVKHCEFCNGSLAEGTDGHGLGECAPVCPTCDGSGTAESIKAVEHATGSKVVTPPADAPQRPSVEELRESLFAFINTPCPVADHMGLFVPRLEGLLIKIVDTLAARGGAS